MKTYLSNIEYAVKKLFGAINHEEDELISLISEREAALKEPKFLENLGGEARKNLPKKLAETDKQIEKITDDIHLHSNSAKILCGALLQFAKQGISIVHKDYIVCPDGRMVGSQSLKEIIWQARNHGIHYEESPNHNPKVIDCFAALEADFGLQFSLQAHPGENLSKEVIKVLGWYGYSTFQEDMLLLS